MLRTETNKRIEFASLYVNSAADRMRSWLSRPHFDDFDSENSFDTKEKQVVFGIEGEKAHLKFNDVLAEVDCLRELLDQAKQSELREIRACTALKEELVEFEKKAAEFEKQNYWLRQELFSKDAAFEKLEHHISRLEAQIADRDTKHAQLISTEAALENVIQQHENELKDFVKKAEDDCKILRNTNQQIRDLEEQVVALRDSFKANAASLSPKLVSDESGSTSSEVKAETDLNGPDERKCKTEIHGEAFETEFSIELEPIESCPKKDSFLDATDYRPAIHALDDTLKSCASSDEFPIDQGCVAELQTQVKVLEKRLKDTDFILRQENRVLQEYVDELRQQLSALKPAKPKNSAATLTSQSKVRKTMLLRHWILV